MKKITFSGQKKLLPLAVVLLLLPFTGISQNKTICDIYKSNGGGYSTTISSVICNIADNTHTITLRVEHNGCDGAVCPAISRFSGRYGRSVPTPCLPANRIHIKHSTNGSKIYNVMGWCRP